MRCSACFEATHVSRAVISDPDRFIDMLEEAQMEHAGCTDYRNAHLERQSLSSSGGQPKGMGWNIQTRPFGKRPSAVKSHTHGSL